MPLVQFGQIVPELQGSFPCPRLTGCSHPFDRMPCIWFVCHNLSRPDPCSVDFGRETPKFRFELCRGLFGGFFTPIFFQGKRPEKIHQKIPRKIHPGLCSEKFPSDFCRSWGNPKQHMKLQQPRNYDLWMFQLNLLGSQGGNSRSREMTTFPPGHY